MAIHYLLGIFDIITSFVLASYATWGWFDNTAIFYHAAYVTIKGGLFARTDFASKVDLVVGVYMFLMALGFFYNERITMVASLWLLQKGVFSIITILKRFG